VLAVQDKFTVWGTDCTPVPDSVIVAGEPVALLVTVTVPLRPPVVAGLKTMPNVIACEGLRVTGAPAPVRLYPVPPAAICEICTSELPVLVIVSFSVLLIPSSTLPKFTLVLLSEMVRVAATPDPLKANAVGEPGALLTILMLPVADPVAVGWNCALNVFDWPGFNEAGSVKPVALKPAPVALTCVMVSVPLPVFVI